MRRSSTAIRTSVNGYALDPDTLGLERMTAKEAKALGWKYWRVRPKAATFKKAQVTANPVNAVSAQVLRSVQKKIEAKVSSRVVRAVEVRSAAAVARAGSMLTAAAQAGSVSGAAAVVAAAAVGYFIGAAMRPETVRLSRELRQEAIDRAYRTARKQMTDQLGRAATLEEIAPLTAAWKKASAENVAGVSTSRGGMQ